MSIILPPKRWESTEDPKYDPIRHRLWFRRLQRRKHIIPMMEGCYNVSLTQGALTQEELCDNWNVSPREFRDFCELKRGTGKEESKTFQHILDGAYSLYCEHNAIRPIQRFIADIAPLYGVNYRHVWECWEVNPKFYPSGYQYK